MTEKVTKKEEAFRLFDEGKTALDPELKALKLKGKTRYNYYLQWKEARGITSSDTPLSESKGKGRVIGELEMLAPPEEVNEEEGEVNEEEGGEEEGGEPETAEPKAKKETKPSDGKKPPPTMVAGQGLTFAITISTKTLMLYQFAASQMAEELTLGDFIDACVEDTYQGRGLDLGLVSTKR